MTPHDAINLRSFPRVHARWATVLAGAADPQAVEADTGLARGLDNRLGPGDLAVGQHEDLAP